VGGDGAVARPDPAIAGIGKTGGRFEAALNLIRRIFSLRRNQLDFNKIWAIILAMALPTEPVILSVEQLDELNRKLSALRHDVNNNLSLMMAATELIRRRPESADRMWTALAEQPQKVAESVAQFSRDLEKALCITRP
jgi:hypothetical protein